MKLIVGLGNQGEKYQKTRHNLGFMVVEHFLKDFEPVEKTTWENNLKLKSDITPIDWQPKKGQPEKIILAKPKTYMNNSGMAVSLITSFYKISPKDVWIIYDELDLPLGSMKIRMGGSSAGHRGIESVIASLKTEKFWRFRLGIGVSRSHDELAKHNMRDAQDFVLDSFKGNERSRVKDVIKRTSHAIQMALEEGIDASMNKYNTK